MKRVFALLLSIVLLSGCKSEDDLIGQVVDLRASIAGCTECNFSAVITADYGEATYTFGMNCCYDGGGDMKLSVTAPESISGITAQISQGTGKLIFDDQALVFEMIADGQISPICGPWLVMEALCSGYISICGTDGEYIRAQIDDSFAGAQFHVDIWINTDKQPVRAEIVWQGRRILSIDINEFVIV